VANKLGIKIESFEENWKINLKNQRFKLYYIL
jgi:hypothetical protein